MMPEDSGRLGSWVGTSEESGRHRCKTSKTMPRRSIDCCDSSVTAASLCQVMNWNPHVCQVYSDPLTWTSLHSVEKLLTCTSKTGVTKSLGYVCVMMVRQEAESWSQERPVLLLPEQAFKKLLWKQRCSRHALHHPHPRPARLLRHLIHGSPSPSRRCTSHCRTCRFGQGLQLNIFLAFWTVTCTMMRNAGLVIWLLFAVLVTHSLATSFSGHRNYAHNLLGSSDLSNLNLETGFFDFSETRLNVHGERSSVFYHLKPHATKLKVKVDSNCFAIKCSSEKLVLVEKNVQSASSNHDDHCLYSSVFALTSSSPSLSIRSAPLWMIYAREIYCMVI